MEEKEIKIEEQKLNSTSSINQSPTSINPIPDQISKAIGIIIKGSKVEWMEFKELNDEPINSLGRIEEKEKINQQRINFWNFRGAKVANLVIIPREEFQRSGNANLVIIPSQY